MWTSPQFSAGLFTFTKDILNRKHLFTVWDKNNPDYYNFRKNLLKSAQTFPLYISKKLADTIKSSDLYFVFWSLKMSLPEKEYMWR